MSCSKNFVLFFEEEAVLQSKLESRAKKSEENISSGKFFSREEAEKHTNQIGS